MSRYNDAVIQITRAKDAAHKAVSTHALQYASLPSL